MTEKAFLTALDVMARYGVSKNTVYGPPLRDLAIRVGSGRSLRWPLAALQEWERGQSKPPSSRRPATAKISRDSNARP